MDHKRNDARLSHGQHQQVPATVVRRVQGGHANAGEEVTKSEVNLDFRVDKMDLSSSFLSLSLCLSIEHFQMRSFSSGEDFAIDAHPVCAYVQGAP